MSKKDAKIERLIAECKRPDLDPHYEGYFACFNRGLFFEAHDVLEHLWLRDKTSSDYSFHKGLIQLAGAFVHLQKHRLRPSLALFSLARINLQKYPSPHMGLDLLCVLNLIESWSTSLEDYGFTLNPLTYRETPMLLPSVLLPN
ncbi:MAG: hypothetical protein JWM04_1065 [Verrucomicrobiales bacterium]|nr:hypothetical protein [Verrucomicrobiales bacterium]